MLDALRDVLAALLALARSSTFWLGLIVNLAAILTTGELSTTLLVAAVASYSAKEGLRYVSERPTSADVVLERAIADLERLDPGPPRELEGDELAAHEKLYQTRVRPLLRHLRALRPRERAERRGRDASF